MREQLGGSLKARQGQHTLVFYVFFFFPENHTVRIKNLRKTLLLMTPSKSFFAGVWTEYSHRSGDTSLIKEYRETKYTSGSYFLVMFTS